MGAGCCPGYDIACSVMSLRRLSFVCDQLGSPVDQRCDRGSRRFRRCDSWHKYGGSGAQQILRLSLCRRYVAQAFDERFRRIRTHQQTEIVQRPSEVALYWVLFPEPVRFLAFFTHQRTSPHSKRTPPTRGGPSSTVEAVAMSSSKNV